MNEQIKQEGRTLAVISYITIIGTIIAFFMNTEKRNPFTAFHTRQALGLWLLEMVLGFVVSGFDSWMITYSFWTFFIVLFLYGVLGAATLKANSVPIIGDFFQKIFKGIGQ